jgi:hypothetical protein
VGSTVTTGAWAGRGASIGTAFEAPGEGDAASGVSSGVGEALLDTPTAIATAAAAMTSAPPTT